ncbi:MAG: hypothetical protein M0P19_02720 [Nevskia sp.]|nr:hypothetical protein [Nevskia sp.]MCK9383881.1 hypothetical protein [Nevskia sp.]
MNKARLAILAFTFLLIGGGAASWFWLAFDKQFTNHSLVVRTEADIVTKVAVLGHLRAGRVEEATALLETLLDGDLISVGALSGQEAVFGTSTVQAIGIEKQARKLSGYAPKDQAVNSAVQEALGLATAVKSASRPSAQADRP